MMRRRFLTAVAAGAVGLALALASGAAEAQKKITVLTWNIPVYKEKIEGWKEDFKKIHPDVTVEWIDKKGPEWPAFYQTQVVAGTPPDIINTQGALWLQYAAAGGLVDLTPYLAKDTEVKNRFYPEFLANWVYKGHNYMLPFYISKTLLFYNKPMLAEAGIKGPPTSFDELIADARKMTKGQHAGFLTLNFDWLYWPLFAMNGVQLTTPDHSKAAFNTPAGIKTLETLAKATSDGAIDKTSWTGRWVEPNNAFATGNIGLYEAHAPAYLYFSGQGKWVNQDTLGVAEMPGGWSTPNSHGLGISKGSKYPDIAWDFIKMVTNDKWGLVFGTTLKNLTGNKAADQQILAHFAKDNPLVVEVLKTQIADLNKLTGNWPLAEDSEIKEAFYPEIQNALLGRKSAKDALADAERKVNRILQQNK